MKTQTIIDGKITLYTYVDKEKRERVSVCAVLPKALAGDWEGSQIYIHNWKCDGDTVLLTYQMRNDAYAPLFDHRFAIEQVRFPIKPPTKSKNWCWSDWLGVDGGFINQKTGEKSYA